MYKKDVYDYIYKQAVARGDKPPRSRREANRQIGEWVGIGAQAVEYWAEVIPAGRAYQIHYMTDGAIPLYADEHYEGGNHDA